MKINNPVEIYKSKKKNIKRMKILMKEMLDSEMIKMTPKEDFNINLVYTPFIPVMETPMILSSKDIMVKTNIPYWTKINL